MALQNDLRNTEAEWQKAIRKGMDASCVIHCYQSLPFNISRADFWSSTGVLVDRKEGLFLTVRHGTGEGPCEGFLVFQGQEYRLQIVYRDPFHDFALVRALDKNGETPDLPEDILLRPNEAQPGREIRIVGNDSGLRSNIGQGYIGRTDANPPRFTEHPVEFQGFNTEYITVSMTINGGASGSLAFNNKGEAVALVCGRFGSISYLLPLDLPLKALRCLQKNKHVTRGTLQIQWELQPLHECKRLGMAMDWIARLDDAKAEYAVCAKVVLPDGPTDGKIATGDILLEIDGNLVTSMLQVELYMDDHVGKLTGLKLWRHNECLEVECDIQDLHEMTPHHLVRRWGTVFHNMPFTVAMDRNIPVQGIVSATTGVAPFGEHQLVEVIEGVRIENLNQLKDAFVRSHNNEFITAHTKSPGSLGNAIPTTAFQVRTNSLLDCEMEMKPREGGHWFCTSIASREFVPSPGSHAVDEISQSMVQFDAHRSIVYDGDIEAKYSGYALICDEQGLALTWRRGLTLFDEIIITVDGKFDAKASVAFLHPALDMALLRFNPADIPEKQWRSCSFAAASLQLNDTTYYAPFELPASKPIQAWVEKVDEAYDDESPTMSTFIPFSYTTCRLRSSVNSGRKGVLLDATGQILGLLSEDGQCLPSTTLRPALESVRHDQLEAMRFRDFDARRLPQSAAFREGLDLKWSVSMRGQQILCINRVPAKCLDGRDHPLRRGDWILSVEDKWVDSATELGFQYAAPSLRMSLVRAGQELKVVVPTLPIQDVVTNRVFLFCGAWLQRPSLAARMRSLPIVSESLITASLYGSAAMVFGLPNTASIVELDQCEVSTLADFVKVVARISFEEYFTVRFTTCGNHPVTISMKKSYIQPTTSWYRPITSTYGRTDVAVVDSEIWQGQLQLLGITSE